MGAFKFCWILVIFGCGISSSVIGLSILDSEDEVFKAHFPTAWVSTGISPVCFNDSRAYVQAYLSRDKWASKMYRTTGLLSLEGLRNNIEVFTSSPGLFDECLAIEPPSFKGKYCSAFFKREAKMDTNVLDVSNEYRKTYRLPQVGFCIPSSFVTITDENYCYTQKKIDSAPQFDGPDIAVIVVLSLLGLLVISATIYDVCRLLFDHPIDTTWKQLLQCFSVLENGRKVLSTESTPSDISCLHGIRVLSASWVILFHTHAFISTVPMENKFGPNKKVLYEWDIQAIRRGNISVDTFFVMSGLLVSYSLLKQLKRNEGRFNIFSFYLHRYMRITPFYFLYLGFVATLMVYIGSGPLWHFISQMSDSCRSNWWTHFLYINNYFPQSISEECMIQSWYLAADMQLFILSPLFVYPLWRWRKIGLAWIIFVIVALIGAIGTIYILWFIPAASMAIERPLDAKKSMFKSYYYQTFGRFPQYLIGILLGWILYDDPNHRKRNKILMFFGWIFCIATIITVIYGMMPFLNEDLVPEINPFIRVTFGSLHHFGWGMAVAWIVFACASGYGGLINTLLSWKGFLPLGRLSFVAYLVHLEHIKVYYIGLYRAPLYYTKFNVMMTYLAVLMVSFILAFILSITIEMPFISLDRLLLNPSPTKKKPLSKAGLER